MKQRDFEKQLAVLTAEGNLLRRLCQNRTLDGVLQTVDEEAKRVSQATIDLNKQTPFLTNDTPEVQYVQKPWAVTCKEVPTANGEPLDFTLNNPYTMTVIGFLLFSVMDDKGRLMSFNAQQIEAFFKNNG